MNLLTQLGFDSPGQRWQLRLRGNTPLPHPGPVKPLLHSMDGSIPPYRHHQPIVPLTSSQFYYRLGPYSIKIRFRIVQSHNDRKKCLISIEAAVFRFIKRVTWDSGSLSHLIKPYLIMCILLSKTECQF